MADNGHAWGQPGRTTDHATDHVPGWGQPGPATGSGSGPAGWREVFRDDFSGPQGGRPAPARWRTDLGTCYLSPATGACVVDHWGTGEVTTMTADPRNLSLDGDGHLAITATRDATGRWASGRIETVPAGFRAPEGGALRVSSRLRLPGLPPALARGYLTAFWMLGAPFRDAFQYDPQAGEIDVMEQLDGQPVARGTLHCASSSPLLPPPDPCQELPDGVGLTATTSCSAGTCLDGFHTFAVEVHRDSTPQRIDWLADGQVYQSVDRNRPGMDDATWRRIVDQSFFVIINLSIGGTWPGAPDPATGQASVCIDDVEVSVLDPHADQRPTTDQHHAGHGDRNVAAHA